VNSEKFVTVYTTYDKDNVEKIISKLNALNITMKFRTSTESTSKNALYEILVLKKDIDNAHDIIIEN